MRGAATITSPAVSSAMRITPSSMARDSGSISSRCSASASVSISSSLRIRAGGDEFDQALEQGALRVAVRGTARERLDWGSDTKGVGSGGERKNTPSA